MSRSYAPSAPLDAAIHGGLRQRIISLELRPGTMIFENAVADEFGVSRTPVRQAFARLVQEGLLEVLPQRGSMVSLLSVRQLREAQALREALEAWAFRELGRIWEAEGRHAELHRTALGLIAQQAQALAAGDELGFTELDVAFHALLIGALDNRLLLETLDGVRAHLTRLRLLELREARHGDVSVEDHRQLLALLAARRPEAVESRLLEHLRRLEHRRAAIFKRHPELFSPQDREAL